MSNADRWKKPTVMVVDDQPGVRRLLQEALRDDSYQVVLAAGGQEAIDLAKKYKPSVLLLDMKMPGMSGLEVVQELVGLGFAGQVVMMTAYGELTIVEKVKKLGVSRYLTKPFDIDEVRRLVKELLECECQKARVCT